MKNGSVTLGQVAELTSHVEVACSRCERRGRYRLSKLVTSLGEDFAMTDLALQLVDCPRMNEPVHKGCDVYFPGLAQIMNGDASPDAQTTDPTDDDY